MIFAGASPARAALQTLRAPRSVFFYIIQPTAAFGCFYIPQVILLRDMRRPEPYILFPVIRALSRQNSILPQESLFLRSIRPKSSPACAADAPPAPPPAKGRFLPLLPASKASVPSGNAPECPTANSRKRALHQQAVRPGRHARIDGPRHHKQVSPLFDAVVRRDHPA